MFRILSRSSTEPPLSFRSCVSPGREVWHCLGGSFFTLECLETSLGVGGVSTWFHSSGTLIRGRGRSPELSPKGCGGGFCASLHPVVSAVIGSTACCTALAVPLCAGGCVHSQEGSSFQRGDSPLHPVLQHLFALNSFLPAASSQKQVLSLCQHLICAAISESGVHFFGKPSASGISSNKWLRRCQGTLALASRTRNSEANSAFQRAACVAASLANASNLGPAGRPYSCVSAGSCIGSSRALRCVITPAPELEAKLGGASGSPASLALHARLARHQGDESCLMEVSR